MQVTHYEAAMLIFFKNFLERDRTQTPDNVFQLDIFHVH